jgi:L-lactate utilization protein LutC
MQYTTLASDEVIETTVKGLAGHNFEPVVVATKAEALAKIKELIPAGASVMNGSSRTLEQVGFVDYLKAGQHGWENLHEGILAEKDPAKQATLRRQALISDYYIGSVHALSQTGEILIASNTGSQLPHVVYSSPNVVLVVSTKKIVPTLVEARQRLESHVVPLEDARMKEAYGMGTQLNKIVELYGENVQFTGRKIHVVLVKEDLGF